MRLFLCAGVLMCYLQVRMAETLVNAVAFPHFHLEKVVDQVDCWKHKVVHIVIQ